MKTILYILRDALQDIWADLWTMLACNLFWLVANALIIPGPPATLALTYFGNHTAHGEVTDFSDFCAAFCKNWGPSWRWGAINFGVTLILFGDYVLTGRMLQDPWKVYLQGLYIALYAGWITLQFFALPFLFEQSNMSVRQALRNAVVLVGKNMGFVLAIALLLFLILAVTTAAFLLSVMVGPAFIACASNRSVINRYEMYKQSVPHG
jgi:uncharacterized membrane protein YesL